MGRGAFLLHKFDYTITRRVESRDDESDLSHHDTAVVVICFFLMYPGYMLCKRSPERISLFAKMHKQAVSASYKDKEPESVDFRFTFTHILCQQSLSPLRNRR